MEKKGREGKPHIGIFGRRNAGKSTFINLLAGQDIAIVSKKPGTTTDPVKKSIEIFGIGPVIMIDTAGIDDTGELGKLRVRKTMQVVRSIDLAIIMISENRLGDYEQELIRHLRRHQVPFFFVHNKSDIKPLAVTTREAILTGYKTNIVEISATTEPDTGPVINFMKKYMPPSAYTPKSLLGGIIKKGDLVLLITPIDNEAPEGRMILPQVQAIRDILDNNCISVVMKETEVEHFLATTGIRPALAITDSQMFGRIEKLLPADIPLTGFSILLARHKGPFEKYVEGTARIDKLDDGDRVLILESCTHQVNCDDIGRYKIPSWLQEYTGKKLMFDVVTGLDDFPRPVKDYSLVIQCGGCMITPKQVSGRLSDAISAGIPVTNYGMAIAYTKGILERALEPLR